VAKLDTVRMSCWILLNVVTFVLLNFAVPDILTSKSVMSIKWAMPLFF